MFAEDRERDGGLILFPNDRKLRNDNFVPWKEAGLEGDHPAKANLHLTRELIQYTSKPGQYVLDPMAGSGAVLLGALDGRRTIAIDIAPHFVKWMRLSAYKMGISGSYILEGDCKDFLPIPVHAIVFSPPYGEAMGTAPTSGMLKPGRDRHESVGLSGKGIESYHFGGSANVGMLSDFLYNKAMNEIYQKCFDSLSKGGKLSLLIKDRISKRARVQLGLRAVQMMGKVGFEVDEWCRWKPPGSMFTNIRRTRGERVVDDEHVIIMVKP